MEEMLIAKMCSQFTVCQPYIHLSLEYTGCWREVKTGGKDYMPESANSLISMHLGAGPD